MNLLDQALENNKSQIPNFDRTAVNIYRKEIIEEIQFLQKWASYYRMQETNTMFVIQSEFRIEQLKKFV